MVSYRFLAQIFVSASVWSCAVGTQTQTGISHGRDKRHRRAEGFVKALEFQHRLRVCNAYPYSTALDVYHGKAQITGDQAMAYKTCRDFHAPLKAGDKLEFKAGDASAGTFSVADLPSNDAILLLVIYRHDSLSTAVSFESHVFANLLNAQIAVINTYKGPAKATPQITDADSVAKGARKEELRYDSVVAVNPGLYKVELTDKGEVKASSELVALNRESYIILRTGVEAEQGYSYPQELVVYPKSDPAALRSKASSNTVAMFSFLIAIATTVVSW